MSEASPGGVMFAYFDETGTSGGAERLTAVAGYLFDPDGRSLFLKMYQEEVEPLIPPDKQGRRLYRTSTCLAGGVPFGALSVTEREHIVLQLAEVIKASVTLGAVVAITPDDYDVGVSTSTRHFLGLKARPTVIRTLCPGSAQSTRSVLCDVSRTLLNGATTTRSMGG
jgi:hypothetical protein